jgi:FkbM family methyltransferase
LISGKNEVTESARNRPFFRSLLGFKSLRLDSAAPEPSDASNGDSVQRWGRPLFRRPNPKEAFISRALGIGRRILPGADLDVFWDDMWVFRVGHHFFPEPDVVEPEASPWYNLAGAAARYVQEAEEHWYYLDRLKAGDLAIDMGGGHGEDTFAFSRAVGPQGRVVAFEAHPLSFAVLKKFCVCNNLSNVTPLNLACVDKPGKFQIESLPSWKQNYIRDGAPSESSFTVDGVPFDWIWKNYNLGGIALLKMNIEGAERLALAGARLALEATKTVCVATHDYRVERGESEWFRTREFVCEFLRDHGFHVVLREDTRPWARDHVHGTKGVLAPATTAR